MAKLADALALGASAARHEGSTPSLPTVRKNMYKFIHPWRTVVYVCCIGTGVLASLLALVGPVADEGDLLSYYTNLVLGPVKNALVVTVLFSVAGALAYAGLLLTFSAFVKGHDPRHFFSRVFLNRMMNEIARGFAEIVIFAGPVILTFVFVSLSMAYINPVNGTRLMDEQMIQVDHVVTGTYPFIAFQNFHYPNWFLEAVNFSFLNLPIVLIAFSLYIFFFNRNVFEEMAAVFTFSLVAMLLFWELFPVLSPHDRFIDNVYHLNNPPAVEQALHTDYHPGVLIQQYLKDMRETKNYSLDGTMPTSTFPSAHVAWATFLVYYTWRTRKLWLIGILPFAILSTIGTVLLAQHYFVDVPAGVLVMILSIILMRLVVSPVVSPKISS